MERWNCLGAPESEVAELVEPLIAGRGLEVGYRASPPYVRVKLNVQASSVEQHELCQQITEALQPFLVPEDLAEEVLELWPLPVLRILDSVTDGFLASRLFVARQTRGGPEIDFHTSMVSEPIGLRVQSMGEEFVVQINTGGDAQEMRKILPYKVALSSERGKRSVAEWVLANVFRTMSARPRQSST